MIQSETLTELTTDDIAKLKKENISWGCFWILAVPVFLIALWWVFIFTREYVSRFDNMLFGALTIVGALILLAVYKFIKGKSAKIDKDIAGRQKKIIVAPITNKRIKSSDITRGREKGGVSMKYFMTVAGRDYPMTEHKYLTIPVGEFMEIHLAPVSKTVLRERWLKQEEKIEKAEGETES